MDKTLTLRCLRPWSELPCKIELTFIFSLKSAIILHGIDQLKIETAPFLINAYTTSGQLNSSDRPYLQNLARDLENQLGNASKLVRESMQAPLMEISMEDKFPGLLTDYEMFRLVVKFFVILSAGLVVVDITIKCDKVLVPKILYTHCWC